MKKVFVLILLAFMATGCATKYVPVPSSLTAPFDVHAPKDKSLDEAVNLANKRGEVIQQCNIRLQDIEALQGTKVPKKDTPN